jgi:predicted alpha/beta-fold hydrolase
MLLKYLGQSGKREAERAPDTAPGPDSIIRGAVCVSPPCDYRWIAAHLEGTFLSRIVNFFMTIPCKIGILCSKKMRTSVPSLWVAMTCTSVRQFEEATIVPLLGYKDSFDYYHHNSPYKVMPCIKVPTLLICADDDPVVPPPPDEFIETCENVLMTRTNFGGHLAFFEAGFWATNWADRLASQVVTGLMMRDRRMSGAVDWTTKANDVSDQDRKRSRTGSRELRRPSARGVLMGY